MNWKWRYFVTSFLMLWSHYRIYLPTFCQCCQHKSKNSYYHVTFFLPYNIHITIYIITTTNWTHIVFSWFSLKCFTKEAVSYEGLAGSSSFVEHSVHSPVEHKESLKYHLKFSNMRLKNDTYNVFITFL